MMRLKRAETKLLWRIKKCPRNNTQHNIFRKKKNNGKMSALGIFAFLIKKKSHH